MRAGLLQCTLATLALLLLASCSSGEPGTAPDDTPVRVRASVDRSDVTPGSPFLLTVEVDRRSDVEFELPDIGAGIEGLVIMDETRSPPEKAAGRVLEMSVFKLKAPLAGTYLIPGVDAPWKTPDLQVGTAGTGPILIQAERLDGQDGAGEEDLRDIKALAPPDPRLWPWVLGASLAGLAIAVLLLLRRLKGEQLTPARVLPPAEQALKDLHWLSRSELLRAEDQGPFAYRVSGILRRYLEGRFGFGAWKMTTQEVLRAMPPELARQHRVEVAVRTVLEASDYVKFAGEPVPLEQLSQWIDEASNVVRETRPRLEPEEGAP